VDAAQELLLTLGPRGGGDGLPLVHTIAGRLRILVVGLTRAGEK
jgi:hypothetical protein